jgi:threonylcarbamoyladenosine tRNA methylthiotransferase MtaB
MLLRSDKMVHLHRMNTTKRVAFYTLGCKLNFSETSTVARLFQGVGYEKVDFDDSPDMFIINTCSVTENADKKCRSLVSRALRTSPHAYVAIIGCYAQLKPEEIAQIPGVDLVLGANEKFNILEHIDALEKNVKTKIHACEISEVNAFVPSYSSGDRTRTFFKVQDGCDYSCSFCTIPLARGKSRSETIASTIQSAKQLIADTGSKEIILTGVNTGDFGKYTGENFFELIQQLDQLNGVERFRISSIEPNLLSDEIIQFVASSDKFVPHFHIPLQSGSNATLRRMRRRYQRDVYESRVALIKELMPQCCIGVDVIVGFPGETEEEFLESYAFLNELDISYLHVFTYSERANTHAVELADVVPNKVRAQRSKMLHILSEKKKRFFYQQQLNKTGQVLWEGERDGDWMYGFTENYIKVKTPFVTEKTNTLETLLLQELDQEGICMGISLNPTSSLQINN